MKLTPLVNVLRAAFAPVPRRPGPWRLRLERLEKRWCPAGGAPTVYLHDQIGLFAGDPNPKFGANGLVTTSIGSAAGGGGGAIAQQADGKIVVAGVRVAIP